MPRCVDRDDRVGGGFENGAQPRFPLFDHRLGTLRLRHIQVQISRIDDGTSAACRHAAPIGSPRSAGGRPGGYDCSSPCHSPALQQLGLDLRPAGSETRVAKKLMGDPADGFLGRPAVKDSGDPGPRTGSSPRSVRTMAGAKLKAWVNSSSCADLRPELRFRALAARDVAGDLGGADDPPALVHGWEIR